MLYAICSLAEKQVLVIRFSPGCYHKKNKIIYFFQIKVNFIFSTLRNINREYNPLSRYNYHERIDKRIGRENKYSIVANTEHECINKIVTALVTDMKNKHELKRSDLKNLQKGKGITVALVEMLAEQYSKVVALNMQKICSDTSSTILGIPTSFTEYVDTGKHVNSLVTIEEKTVPPTILENNLTSDSLILKDLQKGEFELGLFSEIHSLVTS